MSATAGPGRPLAGIRVVDQADEKAELCGRLLADLGADVIRVEPPEGAASRRLPPLLDGESLAFAVRNSNKRGATCDPTSSPDRAALLDLLGTADIWIETTAPDAPPSSGLDPPGVVERLPHLVAVSVTDFGQTGPYRDHRATDPVMAGMGGLLLHAGVPELPPVLLPTAFAYDIAGITAAFAALTALRHRLHTGRGQTSTSR